MAGFAEGFAGSFKEQMAQPKKAKPAAPPKPSEQEAKPGTPSDTGVGAGSPGKMHNGGVVKKTGKILLEKGEKVLPKENSMKAMDKLGTPKSAEKKAKVTGMKIDRLDDGTYHVEHYMDHGSEGAKIERNPRYSHQNLDGLKKHLDTHWMDEKGASGAKLPTSPVKPESETYEPKDSKEPEPAK